MKPFRGAKVMLFLGAQLLVLRRDHSPGISWPGMLDFPGGGREGIESPEACALRETREEVGLTLTEPDLKIAYLRNSPGRRDWFFAAHLPADHASRIVFGNEGLGWQLMPPERYISAPDAIPLFRRVLEGYLRSNPSP